MLTFCHIQHLPEQKVPRFTRTIVIVLMTKHLKALNMMSTRKRPVEKKNSSGIERDPKVTLSDSLIIDIDGIIDNDDEVSLQTPVTIPDSSRPDEFGRAVQDALKERFDDVTNNDSKYLPPE